jgi:hypothetical protein
VSLFEGIDGAPWAFSNGDPYGSPAVLVRLGERLGDQERFTLDYAPANGVNAAQIDPERFLIIGNAGIVITELYPAATAVITRDLTNPMGLVRLSPERFIVASDCAKSISPTQAKSMVCLSEINTASRTVTRLAQLNLTGSGSELAAGGGTAAYLYSHFSGQGIVVQFQTLPVMNRTY